MYLNLYTHNVKASQHFPTGSLTLSGVCVYTLHYMSTSRVVFVENTNPIILLNSLDHCKIS